MPFLNLFPREMQTGDDCGDGLTFDHVEPMTEPDPNPRLNCWLFYTDGSKQGWNIDAPMRIYRP